VNGMTFDTYGHLTGYTAPSTAGTINGVVGADGIDVSTDMSSGVATVSLATPSPTIKGDYTFGAYKITLNDKNIPSFIERVVNLPAGQYVFGNYSVTVNEYGSITDIESIQTAGIVTTSASKKFTQNTGDLSRSMVFTTGSSSAFRISYKSLTIPADIQVYVDDIVYDGTLVGNSYEVLTNSTLGAGQHTVSVQTATETGFTGVGFLDVTLTVTV